MQAHTIDPGDVAEASLIVQLSDTAYALSITDEDRFPQVFATARMIALMELAAARVLRPILQPGQLSVGVSVDVKHTAATPVGARVKAVATYIAPEGRLFRFRVEAFDEGGRIGEGQHVRAIIDTDRLVSGANRRVRAGAPQ